MFFVLARLFLRHNKPIRFFFEKNQRRRNWTFCRAHGHVWRFRQFSRRATWIADQCQRTGLFGFDEKWWTFGCFCLRKVLDGKTFCVFIFFLGSFIFTQQMETFFPGRYIDCLLPIRPSPHAQFLWCGRDQDLCSQVQCKWEVGWSQVFLFALTIEVQNCYVLESWLFGGFLACALFWDFAKTEAGLASASWDGGLDGEFQDFKTSWGLFKTFQLK